YTKNTVHYCFDTESTNTQSSNLPSIIQIEMYMSENDFSNFVLIDCEFLPPPYSPKFELIKEFVKTVLKHRKIIAWGELVSELRPFLRFGLFNESQLPYHSVNVQDNFHYFMLGRTPPLRGERGLRSSDNEEDAEEEDLLIIHAPPKPIDPVHNDWSLQRAIATIFELSMDKSLTLSTWNCGLDKRLNTWLNPQLQGQHLEENSETQLLLRRNMVTYALIDCHATSRLYMHIKPATDPSPPPSSQPPSHLPQEVLSPASPKIIRSPSPPQIEWASLHTTSSQIAPRIVTFVPRTDPPQPSLVYSEDTLQQNDDETETDQDQEQDLDQQKRKHGPRSLQSKRKRNRKNAARKSAKRYNNYIEINVDPRYALPHIREHLNWNLIQFKHISITIVGHL
ncbi:unnamed protein product, partial [Didymodactylos carnosus]